MRDQLAQFDGSRRRSPGLSGFPSAWTDASDGGGNELLVTGTGSCSSGCLEQICTGHKSYKAQLRAPLLLLRIAARASQERLSAERAPKHGSKSLTVSQQPADITQRARAEEGAVALTWPDRRPLFPPQLDSQLTPPPRVSRVLWLVIYPGLLRQISASRGAMP
ncbi:unnamed protein product [Pleuronectes platessa]|uniref:Uncharacterized protein n=1 Tax=Pleuronectes platessa TaxID=8262 RepID=A0A9N7TSG1_PLEPL|nr:unnamed protein product [Pleuronectes platessa]